MSFSSGKTLAIRKSPTCTTFTTTCSSPVVLPVQLIVLLLSWGQIFYQFMNLKMCIKIMLKWLFTDSHWSKKAQPVFIYMLSECMCKCPCVRNMKQVGRVWKSVKLYSSLPSLWIEQEMPEAATVLWLFDSSNRWFLMEQVSLQICPSPDTLPGKAQYQKGDEMESCLSIYSISLISNSCFPPTILVSVLA